MTIPVKWFHSDMVGAPQISGNDVAPGEMISVLDACLLNGFNTQGLDSLTYDSGTGEATATVSGGHGFLKYQVALIEGANESEFNGEQRVTFVDSTTFKFTPSGTPPATATGTITAKAAPIGQWEKAFSGTDKAAYRSTDPLATGFYLRLDDSTTARSKAVSGYESMTDVDTGTNPFDNSCYFAAGVNSPIKWAVVGDSRLFYVYFEAGTNKTGIAVFGDIQSFKPADAYHCVLIANGNNSNAQPHNHTPSSKMNDGSSVWRIARSSNIGNLNFQVSLHGPKLLVADPNLSDGQFYINESPILVAADNDLRGMLPGLGMAHNDLGVGFHIIDDASNSSDVFFVVKELNFNIPLNQPAFNLTGAWR
ncbi:conserved hypothetical protein [Nitrosococcus halophilus Nc 4]|uniref:Uncharacterized protein n=1 Tax=Nitrosococcus halophilus (strain Nc4) TaxID=472759 RepID=D5BYX1_NITHN|nr:hypothetical protein [Nitrosococcus halophilus]ADE14184.1 conserved hypothetical protein [Nitrosococcus halophilus Nc 4]